MVRKAKAAADDKILLALACGSTIEAAARQAGVAEGTVYRRLKEPAFKKRLNQVRADIVKRTAGALTAAATESVRTLMELQKAPTPPPVRLGAARAILELGIKVRDVADIEERLVALEERLKVNFDQD